MDKYVNEFRGQQAFFKLCKMAMDSRFTDPNLHNPQFDYYNQCTLNKTMAKSLLSKIVDKQLVLRDMKLNSGDSRGLRDDLMNHDSLINKLYLDGNGLDGDQLGEIVEGLNYQKEIINLTVQGSTMNEQSAEQLVNLFKRRVPDNLQELHLIHAKCVWRATADLCKGMRQRNALRKLSLVESGLNNFSMVHLCEVVRT